MEFPGVVYPSPREVMSEEGFPGSDSGAIWMEPEGGDLGIRAVYGAECGEFPDEDVQAELILGRAISRHERKNETL
jgi:hypothetical protein